MSLISLPAFLARRREETPMLDIAKPVDNIQMRFLTQGGATVVVTGSGRYGAEDHHWQCFGCGDTDNRIGRWDWEARDQANAHAAACRSMPKPEA